MRNPFRTYSSDRKSSRMTCRTSFLPPGVTVEYQLSLPLDGKELNELLRVLDRELVFPLLRLPQLTNIKGAGAHDTLLAMEGRIPSETESEHFSWIVSTHFLDFPEKNQIRFRWEEKTEPDLLDSHDRYTLLKRDDIFFERFALSLSAYKMTLITRLSGFGPVAAESLSIESDRNSLSLVLSSEGLPELALQPLSEGAIFEKVHSFLYHYFNFSLKSDYQAHQGALA